MVFSRFFRRLWQPDSMLGLGVWLLMCLELGRDNFASIDLWGKLSIAAVWFTTGQFPYHDYFTYTAYGRPWIDHEWLSGMFFYGALTQFGDTGLTLLKWAVAGLMVWAVFEYNRLNKRSGLWPFLILLLGLSALVTGFLATGRPQIFTFALTPVLFVLLARYEPMPPSRQKGLLMAAMFPLGMLWANLHGGFVVGLGVLGLMTMGKLIAERFRFQESLPYLSGSFLFFLGSLVNPYGLEYWRYIYYAVTLPRLEITEWSPVPLMSFQEWPIKLIGLLTVLTLLSLVRNLNLKEITASRVTGTTSGFWIRSGLLLFFLYFGFSHYKHLSLFVIGAGVLLPGLVAQSPLAEMLMKLKTPLGLTAFWEQHQETLQRALPMGLLVGCLFVFSQEIMSGLNPLQVQVRDSGFSGQSLRAPTYPVGAIRFLQQSPYEGKLFTPFMWGEFAYWMLYPRFRVSLDGRLEAVYLMPTFRQMNSFYRSSGLDWEIPLASGADFILVETQKLNQSRTQVSKSGQKYKTSILPGLDQWDVMYEDSDYAVLGNRSLLKSQIDLPVKMVLSKERGHVYSADEFVIPGEVETRFAHYDKEPTHSY